MWRFAQSRLRAAHEFEAHGGGAGGGALQVSLAGAVQCRGRQWISMHDGRQGTTTHCPGRAERCFSFCQRFFTSHAAHGRASNQFPRRMVGPQVNGRCRYHSNQTPKNPQPPPSLPLTVEPQGRNGPEAGLSESHRAVVDADAERRRVLLTPAPVPAPAAWQEQGSRMREILAASAAQVRGLGCPSSPCCRVYALSILVCGNQSVFRYFD